jgi:outer membrane cobalamin receptor
VKHALVLLISFGGVAAAEPGYESRVVADPAQQKRESAEAVLVTPTVEAQRQSADLGTVLDRIEGLNVARQGGLGAEARLSLNGFSGDQIRLFLDGVPLEIAGYAFGITSVPVTLVDRVELYRGVVPLRFGADALGGALNLVSSVRQYGNGVSGSLQAGSFDTVRASSSAHARDPRTGVYGSISGFVDYARNNYDVAVEVPDARGQLHDATVPRFHDSYAARGVVAEGGVIGGHAVDRLTVRGYYSEYAKDLQSNPIMTSPYGAVGYGEQLAGVSLALQQANAFARGVDLDATASYARRVTHFHDLSDQVFDWYGTPIFTRPQPGEIDGVPHDITLWRDSVYTRLGVIARLPRAMSLRVSTVALYEGSHGVSHAGLAPGQPDPLAGERTHLKIVSGVEHTIDLLGGRLQNIAFFKHYHLRARAELLIRGATLAPLSLDADEAGGGDALRLRILGDRLWMKASYEYATRMPAPNEIFGDGILVLPSPSLVPETSHNVNLSLDVHLRSRRLGELEGEVNAFYREARHLILLLTTGNGFAYQNVFSARALGVEGTARWRAPGDWVALEATATYQDLRNVSTDGVYADFRGDRLPNLPWLFVHAAARLQHRRLFRRHDELSLTWYLRYVHAFYRDWESLGAPQYRPTIDAQLSQSVSVVYLLRLAVLTSLSLDVDNLTDARLYDVYGVQRPGRAIYGKLTFSF